MFAGSDTATNRRLPRFASGSTRRVCEIFASKYSFWNWSRSNAARSSSGTPNAREPNTATCCALKRLAIRTCSTNVMPADCAWVCSESASDSGRRPCCANARARPLRLRVAACVAIVVGRVRRRAIDYPSKRHAAAPKVEITSLTSSQIPENQREDDAFSSRLCKGAAGRPTGGSSLTTFTARSWVWTISTDWPASLNDAPASGMSPR
jgi:hypothetical protein